jgi:MoxR-like ATPase
MLHAGVKQVSSASDGVEYGSGDEIALLEEYFTLPGAPRGRPFRAIWETSPENYWRDDKYPGRSLQRMRKDRVQDGSAFFQDKRARGEKDLWGLRSNIGQNLITSGLVDSPVRIADLSIWYGRERDDSDLSTLIGWFESEFALHQADLVGTIYTDDVPSHYWEIPFSPDQITQTEYAEIADVAPEPPTLADSLTNLAERLQKHIIDSGFVITSDLVDRVVQAWAGGDIVVLVGQPGTGKTQFANLISRGLGKEFPELETVWTAVSPDFDEADLIGYERLDGSLQLEPFAHLVLTSDQPLGPHLVILEEFNLARVERYLASVLVATQDDQRRVDLPGGTRASLPVDTFILATCNSYLDEPETRTRLSFPSKRRATIITMPNVLADRFDKHGADALRELFVQMIDQEQRRIEERTALSLGSAFDAARLSSLSAISSPSDLNSKMLDTWVAACSQLLQTPEGRSFMTLGIARDVALHVAYGGLGEQAELRSLGQAMADKIVHQLRGPKARGDDFLATIGELPNIGEITQTIDRMKSGPGDQLLSVV